jgi:DNA gyrase/topoisomerase IV subunit A
LIEQEAVELKNKFSNPRRSMLEDSDSGQLEDIDVIPNEEMLLVIGFVTNIWLLCLYPSIYAFFFLLLD